MTQATSLSKVREPLPTNQVAHLQEMALKIHNEALTQTYAKLLPVQQSLGLEHMLKKRDFFQSFKYSLAKGVAKALGTNDKQVQAVYFFEPSTNPGAETDEHMPLEATIYLLTVVNKPTAALNNFIEALDQGLIRYLNDLPSSVLAESKSILNTVVLTEEAVKLRRGYGSLVSSILAPPFKLWKREDRAAKPTERKETS